MYTAKVAAAAVASVATLTLLYFLSIYPACWLFVNHYISLDAYTTAYAPLFALADRSDLFSELLHAYLSTIDMGPYWEKPGGGPAYL
jgi:hypothetical protein